MHEKIVLPSGLRLILVPFPNVLSATIYVMVGAGSRYETPRQNGISHFLEHMFFRGTQKRPDTRAICEAMDSIGGGFNAATSKHFTLLGGKVAADHFEKGMELIADLWTHPKFDPLGIEKEKSVIAEEIRMSYEEPETYIREAYDRLIWGDNPLGQSTLGTLETIDRLQRKGLLAFFNSLYTQDNIVVGSGGKLNKKKASAVSSELFKHLKPKKSPPRAIRLPRQTRPQFSVHRRNTEQAHVILGFRTFSFHDPDIYPLLVLETLLGGNMSARLFLSIRDELGLAYEISTSTMHYFDVGTFMIHAGLKLSGFEKGMERIFEELRKLRNEKISVRELTLAKESIRTSTVLDLDEPDSLTEWFTRNELLMGQAIEIKEFLDKVEAVKIDDVHRLANQTFRPEKLNLAVIGPFRKPAFFEKLLNQF